MSCQSPRPHDSENETPLPSKIASKDLELAVVIPVYNEHASVRKVVIEWFQEVSNWTENFRILVINDGSTDGTPKVLASLREQLGERLEIVDQPNAGHGQACMNGYRLAIAARAEYVLQIDSDGQCDPQYFFKFWRIRTECDVIYGVRYVRDDGFMRVIASCVLRLSILLWEHTICADANVPYRLMRSQAIAPFVASFPRSFHLANIGLSVLLRKAPGVRHGYVRIRFRERYGGEPHVSMGKFGTKALELKKELASLRALDIASP